VNNKQAMWLMFLGIGAFFAYRFYMQKLYENQEAPVSSLPLKLLGLPANVKATGRVETTTNGRPPGYTDEVSSYAYKTWAEVISPDGSVQWTEVKVQGV